MYDNGHRVIDGALGRAWEVGHYEWANPDQEATKAAWFLLVPSAHPWWPRYLLCVISLADMPGVRPAVKHYPEAEWEFGIWALDPDKGPDPTRPQSWYPLTPPNVIVQFDGCSEDGVLALAESATRAILDGYLPVEPDDYPGARDRWNQAIRATASCVNH